MYKTILVPVDAADVDLARPAIVAACAMARTSGGTVRLVHVLPMTPVMLAEYVPPDFDMQQRKQAEETLHGLTKECGIDAARISATVRQGGIYHEVLEEAKAIKADLIVMSSHRPAMRTYFLGSNAGHVVRYAPCSVLVVRN
ncbi:MAG: universal stress protein [Bradyrhizobium sp.]|nr:universal stress protein [Bradyrhizobium sp.]